MTHFHFLRYPDSFKIYYMTDEDLTYRVGNFVFSLFPISNDGFFLFQTPSDLQGSHLMEFQTKGFVLLRHGRRDLIQRKRRTWLIRDLLT